MRNLRIYSIKDVSMLLTAKTIAENFKANLTELSAIRSNWTEQYANDLIFNIDDAINNHLGLDPRKDLRKATSTVLSIMNPALKDLSSFKKQIEVDFKKSVEKRDEIFLSLGFYKNYKDVQRRSQTALVQLLFTFKTNMTPELRQEIVTKGLKESLIDSIINYSDTFKQANVTQETFKETYRQTAMESIILFNAIYDEISNICKFASIYYSKDPFKKAQFTLRKVIHNNRNNNKAPVHDTGINTTSPTTTDQEEEIQE